MNAIEDAVNSVEKAVNGVTALGTIIMHIVFSQHFLHTRTDAVLGQAK